MFYQYIVSYVTSEDKNKFIPVIYLK